MSNNNKRKVDNNETFFTPEGLQEAKKELDFLKSEKLSEIADRIQQAREGGGIEENAEYEAALEEQSFIDAKIIELEKVLRNAKIIKEHSSNIVEVGSRVKVKSDGKIDEFTIVGKTEANPVKKKISNESPVGAALLGSKKGDLVEVSTPNLSYKYKILEIN